jgi:hypothetical protein
LILIQASSIGPVVRISPNEVHLSDSENYDKIYNVGGAYYKDPIYYGAWGRDTFIFTIVHNDVHRRRRAPFNPFFSRKNVLETESVVQDKVNRLCRRVREAIAADKPINLHAGFRAVSMDVITEYAFDNCGDSLEKDNFGAEWSDSIREAGHMFWFLHQFPFMTPVLLGMPQWLTLLLSPQTGAVTETQNVSFWRSLDISPLAAEPFRYTSSRFIADNFLDRDPMMRSAKSCPM